MRNDEIKGKDPERFPLREDQRRSVPEPITILINSEGDPITQTGHEALLRFINNHRAALGLALETTAEPKRTCLEEAAHVVDGDRGQHYGHPLDNHGNTAEFWTSYLRRKYDLSDDFSLEAEDVPWMMVLLKVSRECNRPKNDNAVDVCGYTRNVEMIQEERARRRHCD